MGKPTAGSQIKAGAVHRNYSPNSNGSVAVRGVHGRQLLSGQNKIRRGCPHDPEAHPGEGDADRRRIIGVMKENRNLRKLLMECYHVQKASHNLKMSIFNERLRHRVEAAIKGKSSS